MIRLRLVLIVLCVVILASCAVSPVEPTPITIAEQILDTSTPEAENEMLAVADTPVPTITDLPTDVVSPTEIELAAEVIPPFPRDLLRMRGEFFSAAGECSFCHQGLFDQSGQDVSIDQHWRTSMMANAARDPYFLATVRKEMEAYPDLSLSIQEKCATCHMPMGLFSANWSDGFTGIFNGGLIEAENEMFPLGWDGVSCTVCHQILDENLEQESSYSGGYKIDRESPAGERAVFGPYPVSDGLSLIMQSASGYVPIQSDHIESAALCGSCHTLFTSVVTPDGNPTGDFFPEQTPYLEWLNSAYSPEKNCQSCHMPVADGPTFSSMLSEEGRDPFYQHLFVGGNRYMLAILRDHADLLKITAEDDELDWKVQQVDEMLQERTAFLEVSIMPGDGSTDVVVDVQNLTGHKFPTGFPSRRAWLHLLVKNQQGEVIFESGEWEDSGRIVQNDNDLDPGRFESHSSLITDPAVVQIYETILADTEDRITTGILSAASYVKDNRLLPVGFAQELASQEISIKGLASDDDDFVGGSDQVVYRVDSTEVGEVTVELLYQSISYRWLQQFMGSTSAEGQNLLVLTGETANIPVVVDSVTESITR